MSEEKADLFLHTITTTFPQHANDLCREIYYSVMMASYRRYNSRKKVFVRHLLKGLGDRSELIRKKLFEFWDEQLSRSTVSRLLDLFNILHDWDSEPFWLSYAVPLLTVSTNRSGEFEKVMFEPLTSSDFFSDITIDTESTINTLSGSQALIRSGNVRATQQPQFATAATNAGPAATTGIPAGSIDSSLLIAATLTISDFPQPQQAPKPIVPFNPTLGSQIISPAPVSTETVAEFKKPSTIPIRRRYAQNK